MLQSSGPDSASSDNPFILRADIPILTRGRGGQCPSITVRVIGPSLANCASVVHTSVLAQCLDDAGGILECNFDRGLLRTLQEAHFWQRLQGQTITLPYQVHDLLKHHERFFLLQSHVRRVVKAYNLILDSLAVRNEI